MKVTNHHKLLVPFGIVRVKAAVLLLAVLLSAACSGPGPTTINLMPVPAVFEGGVIDPLPVERPPLAHNDYGLLYATDRLPADDAEDYLHYLNEPGFIVRLGSARIKAGTGQDWAEARRISLSPDRSTNYPLQVTSVNETSVLDTSYSQLTRDSEKITPTDKQGKAFAALIDQRLTDSGVKDVYVYVHGYRVVFDNAALVSAELWHFLGYRGAFVAYAWPATPRVLAYFSDVETAATMARKLRLFLTFLAEETDAERIHIVGFSAGSRIVVRALEQLALLNADVSDEQIRTNIRIGNVIIVGGDISREAFASAVTDGILRIPDRMVIYVSSADTALKWSRRIFRRERIGEMTDALLTSRNKAFLQSHPSLELIDVSEAAGSTAGNGHGYFRDSPWVSSDLLTLLAYDIDPAERGLVKMEGGLIWTFPPDYIERLRKSLLSH